MVGLNVSCFYVGRAWLGNSWNFTVLVSWKSCQALLQCSLDFNGIHRSMWWVQPIYNPKWSDWISTGLYNGL